MRKNYSKPRIMYESFSVSTNIAAGCDEITNLQNADQNCGWMPSGRWTGGMIFNVGPDSQCETGPIGQYDSLCYHMPEESYNLFTS